MWQQVYDPFDNSVLSTIAAAVPVVTLLVLIATGAVKTHLAALIALAVAIVIAIWCLRCRVGSRYAPAFWAQSSAFSRSAGSCSTSSSCTG